MKLHALWLLPVAAMAQLTPNSVTVTASRNPVLPSDQVVYNVSIGAGQDAGFDEVLAAASAAGITASNFRGVSYSSNGSGGPAWQFELRAPLNNTQGTVGLLGAVQQSLAKDKKFTLSFYVGGSTLSPEAQAAQKCPFADLLTDARTEAQALASAGGATVGNIQSISTGTYACSMTVRFALGGGGQTGTDSINATATVVAPTPAPTAIAVTLTVTGDVNLGLDQALQAVAGAGVTTANLLGINQSTFGQICTTNGFTTPCTPVQWMFRYTAPLTKWKDIVAALTQARGASHPGVTVDFSISADSPVAPACVLPTVLSQAQRRAQDAAAAAGVGVGQLIAISDGLQPVAQPVAVFAALSLSAVYTSPLPAVSTGCSVTAQYAMLH